MATKDINLKKQLIKEGIIGLVALAVLAAGGMLLSNFDDDAQAEKRVKENENNSVRAEHDTIQQQLGTGFEVSAFYDTYVKYHNGDLLLKRDTATQLMTALREKNHLSNLSVTIEPISDITPDFGTIKSGTMTKSEVKVSFGAVTDNSVYNFIEDLERKLPGFVIVQDISLKRTADPSRTMLVELSQHRLTQLISGELTFVWLGVRPIDEESKPAAAAPAAPASKGFFHGL